MVCSPKSVKIDFLEVLEIFWIFFSGDYRVELKEYVIVRSFKSVKIELIEVLESFLIFCRIAYSRYEGAI